MRPSNCTSRCYIRNKREDIYIEDSIIHMVILQKVPLSNLVRWQIIPQFLSSIVLTQPVKSSKSLTMITELRYLIQFRDRCCLTEMQRIKILHSINYLNMPTTIEQTCYMQIIKVAIVSFRILTRTVLFQYHAIF